MFRLAHSGRRPSRPGWHALLPVRLGRSAVSVLREHADRMGLDRSAAPVDSVERPSRDTRETRRTLLARGNDDPRVVALAGDPVPSGANGSSAGGVVSPA
ncbi:MAG: hypothetical protein AVDCRST_MAG19-2383 [uncultured Thermomicrobiales bacterium]|uniref:Uncharacterized protein n=1 Tax=uncultured Thermomicrobiales bacterium TaxID=1645740 RepID=A0A6J4V2N3_9BACT|nr:MAG: hypothetical protein AVDCRST_MAG19-2383 [uncultured Thermomicrobiales bacterium]